MNFTQNLPIGIQNFEKLRRKTMPVSAVLPKQNFQSEIQI